MLGPTVISACNYSTFMHIPNLFSYTSVKILFEGGQAVREFLRFFFIFRFNTQLFENVFSF